MGLSTDIDIDFPDRDRALLNLLHVPAAMVARGERVRHASGVYFQDIPIDPADGLAVWDHNEAGLHGYFKIDFLNNSLYQGVRDEAHLDALLARTPDWALLDDPGIVSGLAHIHRYPEIIRLIKPTSIEDLAICLAIVRPGKSYLIKRPRHEIDTDIWLPTEDYFYKKSHATAYAASIVVQLNLLVEQAHAMP